MMGRCCLPHGWRRPVRVRGRSSAPGWAAGWAAARWLPTAAAGPALLAAVQLPRLWRPCSAPAAALLLGERRQAGPCTWLQAGAAPLRQLCARASLVLTHLMGPTSIVCNVRPLGAPCTCLLPGPRGQAISAHPGDGYPLYIVANATCVASTSWARFAASSVCKGCACVGACKRCACRCERSSRTVGLQWNTVKCAAFHQLGHIELTLRALHC
jgi:hypothetical protein